MTDYGLSPSFQAATNLSSIEAYLRGLQQPRPQPVSGTVRDAQAFKARLDAFAQDITRAGENLMRRGIGEAFVGLVQSNPVGNPATWKRPRKGYVGGRSRNAWQIEVNGVAGREALAALGSIKLGDRISLKNPSPYMEALNRGHSRQAPAGWIDAVLNRVRAKLAAGGR